MAEVTLPPKLEVSVCFAACSGVTPKLNVTSLTASAGVLPVEDFIKYSPEFTCSREGRPAVIGWVKRPDCELAA